MELRSGICLLILGCACACGARGGGEGTDAEADGLRTPDRESVTEPACGDGHCDDGETCWSCPDDCDCSCGDGVCTHGEWCAVCPADCDCELAAATPPMGWNSWNLFACDIDEDLIRGIADALVDSGLAALGYRYVNLDDCWQLDRAEDGTIQADAETFPSGIPALADYVHDKGLRFGLYTCAGTLTCQERPGSYGYEEQDMQTYADWQVDYVKVDWCFTDGLDSATRYKAFRQAIDKAGRPIMLSICNWGLSEPWAWGPVTGELWRTSGDIFDHFIGLMVNLLDVEPLAPFARPGHWNDPDMLEVGNGGMSDSVYRSHFSLWAILNAPLIAGNDVREMTPETRAILANQEVIAVNQDANGLQGVLLAEQGAVRVYARPLSHPGWRAVVLFNGSESETASGTVHFEALGLAADEVAVYDLWQHEEVGVLSDSFSAELEPGASVMVRLEGREAAQPTGALDLVALPWKYAAAYGQPVQRNRSAAEGHPSLRIGGTEFATGLGVRAASVVVYHLGGRCHTFTTTAGLDDAAGPEASVTFEVLGDGENLYDSPLLRSGDAPRSITVDLAGRQELTLRVTVAGDRTTDDLAVWGIPRLECE